MSLRKIIGMIAVLAMTVSVSAQGIPGKDRAIRVGMFKGTGTSRYWHTNIHTAATSIATFLASPTTTGLGADLVVPTAGFSFTQFGTPSTCNTTGCKPTATELNAFVAALDTLDVIYITCMVDIGNVITGPARDSILKFIAKKGYVAEHATNDSYATWPSLDTVHAARFQNHPSSDRNGNLRLDTVGGGQNDSAWWYLNRGLGDTTFVEEWFSFITNANVIRAYPNLTTTVNIDEASYAGGLGGARQMGTDHPMSWYRKFPTGGRFFYTAVGHRVQNYQGGANPRFLRRQLYNAFLWTAGYDTANTVIAIKHGKAPGAASDYSRLSVSAGALTVTVITGGNHSVELLGMDGKRVAFQKGEGRDKAYNFTGLRPGIYALAVATRDGRSNRLVTVQ